MNDLLDFSSYKNVLANKAFVVDKTKGRKRDDLILDSDLIYSEYGVSPLIIDLLKLSHSKMYRRSSHKTQVFSSRYVDPYIRTRMSHQHEIAANGLIAADVLGLNKDLVLVGGLGHDCGHVVFGHTGEYFFSEKLGKEFRHEVYICVVSEFIERYNKQLGINCGLNMLYETLECWRMHSRGKKELVTATGVTEEANLIMYQDKFYIFPDMDDAKNKKYIDDDPQPFNELGQNQRERTQRCLFALIQESAESGRVIFEKSKEAKLFLECKKVMYDLYEKINNKEGQYLIAMLEKVYKALSESRDLGGINPILMMSLMVEEDIYRLVEISNITIEDIMRTSLKGIIKNIQACNNDIDITSFDLCNYIK